MTYDDGSTSKPKQVADTATNAASEVASAATTGAGDAASEAAAQVKVVAGEAKRQVGNVVDQTRSELAQQADARTQQAASGLRTLADQVSALADGRPGDAGPLAGYLSDAQSRVSAFAERLETGGPQALLDDVTDFARRRPMVFLAAAAGAGFLVGRLARAGHAAQQDTTPAPTAATTPSYELPPPIVTADAPLAAMVS